MEKESLRKIKQWILGSIAVVGAVLGVLTLTGTHESLRKFLAGFLIVLSVLFGLTGLVDSEEAKPVSDNLYFVDEVIDGDTIGINGNMKIRLIGIDAPESDECYYEESRDELIRLVQEKYVRLEKDVDSVDGLGRLLRYVYLPGEDLEEDDIFVNEHLLRQGYAQTLSHAPNNRYKMLFVKAREEALIQRRGLWSDECDYLEEFEEENELTREINELPSDPNCLIKGNISSRGAGKLYFPPGCSSYNQIKIDPSKGEQYFCTEEEAIAAGFKKSGNCP